MSSSAFNANFRRTREGPMADTSRGKDFLGFNNPIRPRRCWHHRRRGSSHHFPVTEGGLLMVQTNASRRKLLRYFAASPLLAAPTVTSSIAALFASTPGEALAQSYDVLRGAAQKLDDDGVINSPVQALNVFDFEPAAKKALAASPAHFGYLASGVDDDSTLRANREAFSDYAIRVRRLIDARKVDTSVRIFGETWTSPIALAPVSSQAAFHPEGERAVARAAGKRKHAMILSTVSNTSIEDVTKEHGSPVWYMLYPTDDWN